MPQEENISQFRTLLFSIAYNILGSVTLAEDLVQEAFLKFYEARNQTPVQNIRAYLVKTITNLSINQYREAQYKRTEYPGVWLPEPVVADHQSQDWQQADLLEYGVLTILENLQPYERAVFILKEVVGYDYEAIARVIDQTEAYSRKILSRAKQKVPQVRGQTAEPNEHQKLFKALMEALQKGDHQTLLDLLAEDITLYSDGGYEKSAAVKPVSYPQYVARFLEGIARHNNQSVEVENLEVNDQSAMAIWLGGKLDGLWIMEVENGRIQNIFIQRAPHKLRG